MIRRIFVLAVAAVVATLWLAPAAEAVSKKKIDARVEKALAEFYDKISGGDDLVKRAAGVLVFPKVGKAGIGIGGEYGQGALLMGGQTVGYYSTFAASIGFQLGGQVRKEVILFMKEGALQHFRNADGWEVGVDGSVALVTIGAGGEIDTNMLNQPVLGFIFGSKGLMYNLTLEGAKITEIKK